MTRESPARDEHLRRSATEGRDAALEANGGGARGELTHLEQLAAQHGPRVLGHLRRRTDPDTAAEVWQEVLVVAWRRPDKVPHDDEQALAWLIGTARRVLANHVRGATRRHAATERLADELRTHGDAAEWSSTGQAGPVAEALQRLSPADADLLRLVYWDDLTTEQAATVLGIRPAACRKRLERARAGLRRQLETPAAQDAARVTGRSSRPFGPRAVMVAPEVSASRVGR